MANASGVDRQLGKIQVTLKSGAYYEAQQMYKTVYHRYKARQDLSASYHILCEGAVQQLENGQVACGAELGLLLVEAYNEGNVAVNEETYGRLVRIIKAFPPPTGEQKEDSTNLEECMRFCTAAMKWAHSSDHAEEARKLRDLLGRYIWTSYGLGGLGLAIMHLIQGADADILAEVLSKVIPQGKPEEADLFIARAVLQVLASARNDSIVRQLKYAKDLSAAAKQRGLWKTTPLLNMTDLVVKVLEQNMPQVYGVIRERYQRTLQRDPLLDALMFKIEQTYFEVDNGGGMGGLLGNFMKMLSNPDDI